MHALSLHPPLPPGMRQSNREGFLFFFLGCCVLAVSPLLALPFLWCGCEKENQSSLLKADGAKITLYFASYLSKQCSLSPAHVDCHENCWILSGSKKQIVLPRCQSRKVDFMCFPSECHGAVINDRWLIQTDFSPGNFSCKFAGHGLCSKIR